MSPFQMEIQAEAEARKDGARTVGERHILAVLEPLFKNSPFTIQGARIRQLVREAELGPSLELSAFADRRNLVVDASAAIEYRLPDVMDWAEVAGDPEPTLWLVPSVLRELDEDKRSSNPRLRRRSRAFARWLWPLAKDGASATGVKLANGARLKMWVAPAIGYRDEDHIESALVLAELGLQVTFLTDDILAASSAVIAGLEVIRLDDERVRQPET